MAGRDGVAEHAFEIADGARATGRGDARPQGPAGVAGGHEHDLGIRPPGDGRQRTLGRVQGVVGMGVDEPRQQGQTGPGHDLLARCRRSGLVRLDGRDAAVGDGDVAVLQGVGRDAIDDPDVAESMNHADRVS